MRKNVWIMNHYAAGMLFDQGGRHYNFAKYLKRAGYEPVVFGANSKHGPAERFFETDALWHAHMAEEIGVPFIFVKARTYVGNGKQRVLNMLDFYRNVKKAAKEYAKQHGKPDVIYASSVHPLTLVAGIQLAKHFGVKCVCEVRDLWPEGIVAAYPDRFSKKNPLVRLLYAGEKWIYKKADHVIMTWPGGYDYIVEQGWDRVIPREKVSHISNGVDLEAFFRNQREIRFEDPDLSAPEKFHAVYTGSIRRVNYLRLLVDAAEILEQRGNQRVQILVWGAGDEREALTALVQEKGLGNIRFKGPAPKSAIPSILGQADLSVLHNTQSILDKYGQSQNKFFEYLAAGRPILMTYSVGHSVCRARGCGEELPEQTAKAVADAIDRFSQLPEDESRAYALAAAETAKDYDFKALTNKLIGVLESDPA